MTLTPILSLKRIKPTNNCLEAVNSSVSVSMVKFVRIQCIYLIRRFKDALGVFKQNLYLFYLKRR